MEWERKPRTRVERYVKKWRQHGGFDGEEEKQAARRRTREEENVEGEDAGFLFLFFYFAGTESSVNGDG